MGVCCCDENSTNLDLNSAMLEHDIGKLFQTKFLLATNYTLHTYLPFLSLSFLILINCLTWLYTVRRLRKRELQAAEFRVESNE